VIRASPAVEMGRRPGGTLVMLKMMPDDVRVGFDTLRIADGELKIIGLIISVPLFDRLAQANHLEGGGEVHSSATSEPLDFDTGSTPPGLIIAVAPRRLAVSNFSSLRPKAMICDADKATAPRSDGSPTPPYPMIATVAPTDTRAVLTTAPKPVAAAQLRVQLSNYGSCRPSADSPASSVCIRAG
jgi:hypothetical protein